MDFASKQIFDVKLWENGVSPSQLFKDEEYIKLGEQAIKNLRQAYGQGLVSGKDAGRVTSLINTQMDYGFADTMAKNLNNPQQLADSMITRSEKLIRDAKVIPHLEGHHMIGVGSSNRFKNFPLKKKLQINAILDSTGRPMGTTSKNLAYLSKNVHSSTDAIAHINPWAPMLPGTASTDTGLWSTNEPQFLTRDTGKKEALLKAAKKRRVMTTKHRLSPFHRNLDPFTAARRFAEQSADPQIRLAQAAWDDPAETAARNWVSKLYGVDPFKVKNSKAVKEVYKVSSALGLDINKIHEAAKSGNLPDLSKVKDLEKIQKIVKEASRGGKIKKEVLKWLKLTGVGSLFTVGALGLLTDTAGAAGSASKVVKGENVTENLLRTTGHGLGVHSGVSMLTKGMASNPTTGLLSAAVLGGLWGGKRLTKNAEWRKEERRKDLEAMASTRGPSQKIDADGNPINPTITKTKPRYSTFLGKIDIELADMYSRGF